MISSFEARGEEDCGIRIWDLQARDTVVVVGQGRGGRVGEVPVEALLNVFYRELAVRPDPAQS